MSMGLALSRDDNERRAYGSVPAEIHQLIVDEYEKTGVVPTSTTLSELTGISQGTVAQTMKRLCDEGLLAQPYGPRTPYVPLYRPDGARVKPVLVVIGEDGKEVPREAGEEKSAVELLREALRKMEAQEG